MRGRSQCVGSGKMSNTIYIVRPCPSVLSYQVGVKINCRGTCLFLMQLQQALRKNMQMYRNKQGRLKTNVRLKRNHTNPMYSTQINIQTWYYWLHRIIGFRRQSTIARFARRTPLLFSFKQLPLDFVLLVWPILVVNLYGMKLGLVWFTDGKL